MIIYSMEYEWLDEDGIWSPTAYEMGNLYLIEREFHRIKNIKAMYRNFRFFRTTYQRTNVEEFSEHLLQLKIGKGN